MICDTRTNIWNQECDVRISDTLITIESFHYQGPVNNFTTRGADKQKKKEKSSPTFRSGDVSGSSLRAVFTWARITFRKTFQNVIRPFPDFSSCERKAVSNQAFETRFEMRKKKAFWIMIRLESLILGHVNAKLFRNMIRACAF